MKKNLNALKKSVDAERQAVQSKNIDIENRIAKAESLFSETKKEVSKSPAVRDDDRDIVKDTFSMKRAEYNLIKQCMDRGLDYKYVMNKSEVVRAGLVLLASLPDDELMDKVKCIEKIKLGRPKLR